MNKKPILILTLFLGILMYNFTASAQQDYVKPKLSNKDSWSLVLIPDPQSYVKFERNVPLVNLMTAWIKENVDSLNTQFVLYTGDLVEQNDLLNPNGNGGDGWLRYLEFLPDGKTVKVKTFSPLFAISPATQSLAYKTEKNQEFEFEL
ncbi:hypothetical protein [Sphingobacterium sp. CZ-2]|uniref:hypothetical protein n=1 Tax=Sphingobacterium sp. CZ-2 TaxID=2557994 RepID=UPI00106F6774|nr:hypothetical protein [Sphingobacterium sp. CZ-2]QBR12205.1 hypothetical protein E3D81_08535 [Sphingobacterium sp. CZ-2]